MIIKSIELNNFFIIGNAQVDLHNRGLVRISGENHDDSTSSSNGSGKSALVEGIYWALFGDTLRSLKSVDHVVNNKVKKDCYVKLEFIEGDNTYRVERYRKHSKHKNNLFLFINDVDSRGKDNRETQSFIEDLVGMDAVSFSNSIIFGQGYSKNLRRFSELTDKEQKECLEKILNLEIFSVAHEEVRGKLKEMSSDLGICRREKDSLDIQLSKLKNRLEESQQSHDSFSHEQDQKIAAVLGKRDVEISEIDELQTALDALPVGKSLEEVEQSVNKYKGELETYTSKKERLTSKYNAARSEILVLINGIKKEVATLRVRSEKLSNGEDEGEECFYCGAFIAKGRIHKKKEEIEFEAIDKGRTVQSLSEKLERLEEKYKEKLKGIAEILDMIAEVLTDLDREKNQIFSHQQNREKLKYKIDYQQKLADTYAEEAQRIAAEENPWKSIVDDVKTTIADSEEQSRVLDVSCKEMQDQMVYYEFWKKGFSREGIRSYLLDRIVPFLNERANKYLEILTGAGIQVNFSARKQLGSGEWKESFNVEVLNTNAANSYEGNSGGEKRRIDLAISLAINDFIANRSGKRINLLLLDEVFENIDETGVYFVVKVLEELTKSRSSVFVITHHDSLASYFNETITLSRRDGVAYIN